MAKVKAKVEEPLHWSYYIFLSFFGSILEKALPPGARCRGWSRSGSIRSRVSDPWPRPCVLMAEVEVEVEAQFSSDGEAMRKFIFPADDETFAGWTVQQLKAYLRARSAHLTGRRADLLERWASSSRSDHR